MSREKTYRKSAHQVALLAMIVAITHISRLAFGFLPNVQPVTVILMLLTVTFGLTDAIIVAFLSIVLSNITLGMGFWTVTQICAYSIIVLLTFFVKRILDVVPYSAIFWTLFAGLTGYLYGFVISFLQAPILGMNLQATIGYWLAGLLFDTYHAIGNVGFYILLSPILLPLFDRAKENVLRRY